MGRNIKNTDFIQRAKCVHGDLYDYSQVVYRGVDNKVIIICRKHGTWKQAPIKHLAGCGCPKCIGRHQTTNDFIKKATQVHGDLYDYSNVKYTRAHTKIEIICSLHGSFYMTPVNHISHRQGCSGCKSSKGEKEIRSILQSKNVIFEEQKRFQTCRSPRGRMLKFDFFIPSKNVLIEYDGIQHFRFYSVFHKTLRNFRQIQKLDEVKNDFCKKNNYHLYRIRYNENIEQKIINLLDSG